MASIVFEAHIHAAFSTDRPSPSCLSSAKPEGPPADGEEFREPCDTVFASVGLQNRNFLEDRYRDVGYQQVCKMSRRTGSLQEVSSSRRSLWQQAHQLGSRFPQGARHRLHLHFISGWFRQESDSSFQNGSRCVNSMISNRCRPWTMMWLPPVPSRTTLRVRAMDPTVKVFSEGRRCSAPSGSLPLSPHPYLPRWQEDPSSSYGPLPKALRSPGKEPHFAGRESVFPVRLPSEQSFVGFLINSTTHLLLVPDAYSPTTGLKLLPRALSTSRVSHYWKNAIL